MKERTCVLITFVLIHNLFISYCFAQNSTQLHLPDGVTMRIGKGRANDIIFSPDGKQFAVTTNIGIWIYDAKTGAVSSLIRNPGQSYGMVAFSPDGNILAGTTGTSRGGEILLWNINTGKQVKSLGCPHGVKSLYFSDDGSKVSCAGIFGHIRVWDLSDISNPSIISDVKLGFNSWSQSQLLKLSPDTQILAITNLDWQNRDFSIQLWDTTSGKLHNTLTGHTRWIKSIAFTPDSKTLISGDEYETIRMWDVETGTLKHTLNWRGIATYALEFSSKGRYFASGHRDGVRLWTQTIDNRQQWKNAIGKYHNIREFNEHKDYVYKFTFSPDEITLLTGSKDGTIIAWDTTTGKQIYTCTGHMEGVRVAALSETGQTITTLNQPVNPPGRFQQRRWDVNTGKLHSISISKNLDATTMKIAPDGKTLATHGVSGRCVLWDINSDSPQRLSGFSLMEFPRSGLNVKFAFSLDGKSLAAGGEDGSVHVWSLTNNAKNIHHEYTLREYSEIVWSLEFSPDGSILATGGRDQTFHIRNALDGKSLHTLSGHSWRVNSFAFTPNNQILASGSTQLYLWHVESGKRLKHINQHENAIIEKLTFSNDGNILLIGARDGLKLYHLPSDRLTTINKDYTSIVNISEDGKTLVSGSNSGEILIWDWQKVKKQMIDNSN